MGFVFQGPSPESCRASRHVFQNVSQRLLIYKVPRQPWLQAIASRLEELFRRASTYDLTHSLFRRGSAQNMHGIQDLRGYREYLALIYTTKYLPYFVDTALTLLQQRLGRAAALETG